MGSSIKGHDGIFCYCNEDAGCGENETCLAPPNAKCFHFIEDVYDETTRQIEVNHIYGCLPPEEGGSPMQCHADLSPHHTPKSIACCWDTDYCNLNITPKYKYFGTAPTPIEKGTIDSNYGIILIALAGLFVFALILIVLAIWIYKRKKSAIKKRWTIRANDVQGALLGGGADGPYGGKSGNSSTLSSAPNHPDDMTDWSGSGSGVPQLVQRTIARQLRLEKNVGKGRFGEVFMGYWNGDKVAVKIFQTTDEMSWQREKEIYQTMMLRHENILCFIAADIGGTGGTTHMLLVTDYHEHGSLHDFLNHHVLDYETTCRLAQTAAAGLAHLHVEITGTEGKPGIAHRDIKSKNILVKSGGVCVIADFGLAVRHISVKGELDIMPNPRQGTIRYMAPEVLNKSINRNEFEAYKRADMYAFGLVLWEIATRCFGRGYELPPYMVPYEGMVPKDPSFEIMRDLVCSSGPESRPVIYGWWRDDKILHEFAECMEECWKGNPHSRLPSLNVKKRLAGLRKKAAGSPPTRYSTPSPPPPSSTTGTASGARGTTPHFDMV